MTTLERPMRNLVYRLTAICLVLFAARPAGAQTAFRRAGVEFNAQRSVTVPLNKGYTVVVTQFFHHGEIAADGRNVVVTGKNQKLTPCRVLQLGPGDYCRLAFELAAGQGNYEIFYGGEPPAADAVPKWSNADGLLLETREYKHCNLNSFEAVRDAFESSKRIGADYVEAVHHSSNPFALTPAPFLSRYTGTLRIDSAGKYGFMTSSQDCSFLVIDDKVAVASPGAHHPQHQARPGSRTDLQLAPGGHKFEYYHAASGPVATMAAALEINPAAEKPAKVQAIPMEWFHASAIGHVDAGQVTLRTEKLVPDFQMRIAGSVPLPDNDVPLVAVQFRNYSPRALTMNSKCVWEFGDGQESEEEQPTHVYLHPGLYTVKLMVRRSTKPFGITNRIYVEQPRVTSQDKLHKLEDYLPLLATYDARALDAASLSQLVQAFQAKAEALVAAPETPELPPGQVEELTPEKAAKRKEEEAARRQEALKYITTAVAAGRAALVDESAIKGDDEILKLARLVGPMARDQLGDSRLAGQIWAGAAKRIGKAEAKAECQIHAADIAINDMVNPAVAKTYLDGAAAVAGPKFGELGAHLSRIWGDYYALTGDGKAARKAYADAETMYKSRKNNTEAIAWQGAHGRSTEQFLKTGELDRAVSQIRQWQADFPADKINGNITLMYARYWAARQKYPQVLALAGQLTAVNADSPYIDALLLLATDCELLQGERDKAIARLQSFLKSYPGSPLVPQAKEKLGQLKSEGTKKPAPKKKPS